ncbi:MULTISPECIES: ribosome hibernation-promoting factor, HPF/YfiA family [Weeksella]|uniref:Ribosomal subunit interface protein n=1 Tax=Weeksella virosa (strain ATCC 43766 / DSM 16922 / JCM 21250 / CCUG 30538 / CDC 9751 / IAM 14551 / NBRC 16016 / NCTC 11634 / CL345/78) TaxID=865938 RepID=F0P0F9_WEEVC|nr:MULTISPECIES: ribosome-associated translation inhibitor RaiA [Weeksella]ADX67443.1 ribosomal subunit interface protein [Weeksella virosa DSM 16922]MDK7374329.1 ribosome-associated translation inhibitor RaiA [Weeksella virosa]MDK7675724.1 ribosome-associated translation inhibitor RaiA [Weeksella virosa]OFM82200.1 RNA polymerase subunit sigma-54 [Weeksella sp. HMSC059D05]SUP53736.1 ribosome hibernation promoting factor HPF [Weeksella virosa]
MKVKFQAINFNAKQNLEDYLEQKLAKLDHLSDKIIAADVSMKLENTSEKDNKSIDIRLEIPGDDIIVSKKGQSFEECIDLSIDTLKRLIIKRKEKIADR